MNSTSIQILLAALTFNAPAMEEYVEEWELSTQTEEEAAVLIAEIKDRFHRLSSTDHAGMAELLGVPCVTYTTPALNMLANTVAPSSEVSIKSRRDPNFITLNEDGEDEDIND